MRISCSVHQTVDHDLHRTVVFIVVAGFLCACNHYLLLKLCHVSLASACHYNHRTIPVTFCCVAVIDVFVWCCVLPFLVLLLSSSVYNIVYTTS